MQRDFQVSPPSGHQMGLTREKLGLIARTPGQARPGQGPVPPQEVPELEPQPPGRYADNDFGLLEGLEKLCGRPVDLVVASVIQNPYFRQSVERTKALLYAA